MSRKHITDFRGDMPYTPNGRSIKIKEELVSPTDEGFLELGENSFDNVNCYMRKSLSVSDLSTIKEEIYRRHRQQSCTPEQSKIKFVSVAESIYHFQRNTPDRFHTWKRSTFVVGQAQFVPHGLTRPQSPKLRCKDRARSHHVLSQKEREELELAEIRKFKIKANPIPKSVIEGPTNLPGIQRKPLTVPEPFQLTEVIKKPAPSPEPVLNFKARPAPKHILEKPKVGPIRSPAPVTKAVSPKFHYKRVKPVDSLSNLKKNENQPNKPEKHTKTLIHHGPVKPEPFSFEKRDEELKRKHEENIKRQLEEERKLASQFKAQPLPVAVKKIMKSTTNRTATSSTTSENKENCAKFEAKPPVVLYKKPFKPVLQPTQIMSKPFDLATQKRATEREQFDKLMKEKEEENKKYTEQKEREQQKAEERALQELRAKLVHHAKPIPPLVPNLPEKLNIPLTVPETPKFLRRQKK
ncbi:targeting protein for Xklp2 [Maniola hyperantus]|uniref:targeting protein for Xklp2 n=1 Tax=Aphantopus hyperantus TaxID=2795564 RepID=UPI001568BF4B|nr:targeting protein for Xklp2 [Maniola hyperantus]